MSLTALVSTTSHKCPAHYSEIYHNQLRPNRSSNIDSTNTDSLTLSGTICALSLLMSFRQAAPHSPCSKVSNKQHNTVTVGSRQSRSAELCLPSAANCRSCRQYNKKYCENYHVYSVICLQHVTSTVCIYIVTSTFCWSTVCYIYGMSSTLLIYSMCLQHITSTSCYVYSMLCVHYVMSTVRVYRIPCLRYVSTECHVHSMCLRKVMSTVCIYRMSCLR